MFVVSLCLFYCQTFVWRNTLAYNGIRTLRIRNVFIVQSDRKKFVRRFLKCQPRIVISLITDLADNPEVESLRCVYTSVKQR
jgi:hypothetical protein